jgi:8-oxo-dGTP diphosphatase
MEEPKHLDELGQVMLASECYIVREGKVLMFKRSDSASNFPGWWIGPGGHIDEGEDAQLAAIREMYEEAGIRIGMDEIKLKAVAFHHHLDRNEVWVSFVFLANISKNQVEKKEDVEGKAKWIPLKELLVMDKVFPPAKFYYDHVLNNKPGIMYTNIQWEKAELVKVLSQRVDTNG